ncbi:MAG: nucleoside hydrolase [Myxococcota bacterium]
MPRRLVLDTDMGSDADDALCLALALAAPELELAAVTCVGRESRLRAQIARRLLELAGHEHIPVYAGCRVPLLGGSGYNWFGHEGQGILEPGREPEIQPAHAADALLELSEREPGLEIAAVGPLTNLALALAKDPDFAARVGRLTVMGGHLREVSYRGRVFPFGVDYNLCSDPHASLVVLRSGIPIRLVTADVTLQTWLRDSDIRELEKSSSPLAAALARAVRLWTPVQRQLLEPKGVPSDNAAFLHDPLTLACVYDESFCGFESLEIEPAISDGVFRTLERAEPGPATTPMRCATSVDAERFRAHFLERVR